MAEMSRLPKAFRISIQVTVAKENSVLNLTAQTSRVLRAFPIPHSISQLSLRDLYHADAQPVGAIAGKLANSG